MTGAVLYYLPVAVAALAGLVFGFGRYWENACLLACLWVPLASSVIYAAVFVPTLAGALMWAVILFLGEIVASFITWGLGAGIHHGTYKLWRRFS
ncbi:MAG TPA: hypothetical protein VFJ70_18625 [Burkholderiales bacterium]|nr:hypothetical protein [Burkholderiales bacterium]